MELLKRATVNEEALRKFREESRIAAAKDRVVHAALNKAAKQIVAVYGPNISLDASKDSLTETRQGIFSGKIEAQLSVETGTGIKRIAYPIEIRASTPILDNDENVKAALSQALSATASDEDKEIEAKCAAIDEKVAECYKAEEEERQIDAMVDSGMSREEALIKVLNIKAAVKAEAQLNHIEDAGMDNVANIGINNDPQAIITIAASNLPASYSEGDVLDVQGIAYECIGKEGSFLKFKIKLD